MINRTMLLSLAIGLNLFFTPATQTISWDFWKQSKYKNIWITGASMVTIGLLYSLWQYMNRPDTIENFYTKTKAIIDNLNKEYAAKIAAFEQGYGITGDDIALKSEQFEYAQTVARIYR